MTMITPSYLGETIEYSSLHACRSTLEDPTSLFHPIAEFLERRPARGQFAHPARAQRQFLGFVDEEIGPRTQGLKREYNPEPAWSHAPLVGVDQHPDRKRGLGEVEGRKLHEEREMEHSTWRACQCGSTRSIVISTGQNASVDSAENFPRSQAPPGNALPCRLCLQFLVPRLRLGTHCLAGSACKRLGETRRREAEPRGQCVPRRSLGTSCFLVPRLRACEFIDGFGHVDGRSEKRPHRIAQNRLCRP